MALKVWIVPRFDLGERDEWKPKVRKECSNLYIFIQGARPSGFEFTLVVKAVGRTVVCV